VQRDGELARGVGAQDGVGAELVLDGGLGAGLEGREVALRVRRERVCLCVCVWMCVCCVCVACVLRVCCVCVACVLRVCCVCVACVCVCGGGI